MAQTSRAESELAGRRVHVVGLGKWGTGRAAARAAARRGARVSVSDIKPAGELASEVAALEGLGLELLLGEDAYRGIEEADLVVVSPGVPLDIEPLSRARASGARVVSEIEVAWWIAPCPIAAVTGTKGKTTTAALIGELLCAEGKRALVGGNIGRPLVELAEQAGPGDLLVAEISSFQLEAIEGFRPRAAALLNLSPDHLDRHQTLEVYQEAKARIFVNQGESEAAILNRDDEGAWGLRGRVRGRLMPYSLEREAPGGADLSGGWLRVEGQRICPAEAVRLPGRHNLGNALAALAVARAMGATLEAAEAALVRFRGLEHRLEAVAEVGATRFVNDSQATTPAATVAALEACEGPVALIAGGRAKVHDFGPLAEALARRGGSLVVIGEAGEEIAAAARRAGVGQVAEAGDLEEAVARAAEQLAKRRPPGGVVLLSPACASFDMFEDMAERGRRFREAVQALARRAERRA